MPLKRRSKRARSVSESNQEMEPVDREVESGNSETSVPTTRDDTPLTRNDIPGIVQEITRQLRPESSKTHSSPPPSMFLTYILLVASVRIQVGEETN